MCISILSVFFIISFFSNLNMFKKFVVLLLSKSCLYSSLKKILFMTVGGVCGWWSHSPQPSASCRASFMRPWPSTQPPRPSHQQGLSTQCGALHYTQLCAVNVQPLKTFSLLRGWREVRACSVGQLCPELKDTADQILLVTLLSGGEVKLEGWQLGTAVLNLSRFVWSSSYSSSCLV